MTSFIGFPAFASAAAILFAGCGSRPPGVSCESDQFLTEVCGSYACVSAPPECADAPTCACLVEFGACDPDDGPCNDVGSSVELTLEDDPSACFDDGGQIVVALATIDGC